MLLNLAIYKLKTSQSTNDFTSENKGVKGLNNLRELIKQTSFADPSSKGLGKIKVEECKVTGQLKLLVP